MGQKNGSCGRKAAHTRLFTTTLRPLFAGPNLAVHIGASLEQRIVLLKSPRQRIGSSVQALRGHAEQIASAFRFFLKAASLETRVRPSSKTGTMRSRLLAYCGILNSKAFKYLLGLQLARAELAQSFEVGLI